MKELILELCIVSKIGFKGKSGEFGEKPSSVVSHCKMTTIQVSLKHMPSKSHQLKNKHLSLFLGSKKGSLKNTDVSFQRKIQLYSIDYYR